MIPNRPELALFRGKEDPNSLELMVTHFAEGDRVRGQQYAQAIRSFLGKAGEDASYVGSLSYNTKRAYSFAVMEFFEWVANKYGRVVPPHKVVRADAMEYVDWLANRPYSLVEERLRDGDRNADHLFYLIVQKAGKIRFDELRKQAVELGQVQRVDVGTPEEMDERLGYLVRTHVLSRSPTMVELRKQDSQIGISRWEVTGPDGRLYPLRSIFTYSIPPPEAVKRTTIAQRLAALSSFWKALMLGENADSQAPILRFDVWDALKKRVSRGISTERKQAARASKVPPEAVLRMLRDAPSNTLIQQRNRALLYYMALTGSRVSETTKLRRGPSGLGQASYFEGGDPPSVSVLRKGSKRMRLPYPPAALRELIVFQSALDDAANAAMARGKKDEAVAYQQLLQPEAPLFPPLGFWGKNAMRIRPLSRNAVAAILKLMAEDVKLDAAVVQKMHPHAVRHFAASAMLKGGKDMREVQYILGHDSITTTELYLDDVDDAVALSGQDAILKYASTMTVEVPGAPPPAAPAAPAAKPQKPTAQVIETEGEVQEAPPPAPPADVQALTRLQATYQPPPPNAVPKAPTPTRYGLVRLPRMVATEQGDVAVMPTSDRDKLVAVSGEAPPPEAVILEVANGKSSGAPDEVYLRLAEGQPAELVAISKYKDGGKGEGIPIQFFGKAARYQSNKFLAENYDPWPHGYGIGQSSLLPWMQFGGRADKHGFLKGVPPMPVWSAEQADPETKTGAEFVEAIDELYADAMLSSPERSAGLLRWFQFFIYHANKLDVYFVAKARQHKTQFVSSEGQYSEFPTWYPYDSVVPVGAVRSHKLEWLFRWLQQNSHTYKTSVRAFKDTTSREDESKSAFDAFWLNVYEGFNVEVEIPAWFASDDPVHDLSRSPETWKRFTSWLSNVTGQILSEDRQEERKGQLAFASVEQARLAKTIRETLDLYYETVDEMAALKRRGADVSSERFQLQQLLFMYANSLGVVVAPNAAIPAIDKALEAANRPVPTNPKYTAERARDARITLILTDLFPDEPSLVEPNLFRKSRLFDTRYFVLDEKARTVVLDKAVVDDFRAKYGQSPLLLVRRALRAMWEYKNRSDAKIETQVTMLQATMLCYFSWIVPSGADIETHVTMQNMGNQEVRRTWLNTVSEYMRELVAARFMPKEKLTKAQKEERKQQLMRDTLALQTATDIAALTAVVNIEARSPEELYAEAEEADIRAAIQPKRRKTPLKDGKLTPNRSRDGVAVMLSAAGEPAKHWFRVGMGDDFQRNASDDVPEGLYLSMGAIALIWNDYKAPREALPSPFAMMRAMLME